MSKLTSDRSTRMLNELLQLPGNNTCADCGALHPRWASYSLGIFLCMSCASVHRKLGTHVSKVKSIHMDQWTKDQIETIRVRGNLNSNAIYNPKKVDAPVNLHDSERDSELEKFIRNKYQFRKYMNMHDESNARSSSRGSERIDMDRSKTKELLAVAPPPRSSSSHQPRAASPVLTTKSPVPPSSISPAPTTPSPSIPGPASQTSLTSSQPPLQMLSPSAQPPLQMLNSSSQPPLQIMAPSMSVMPMQTGLPSTTSLMPAYQTSMYTGVVGPMQTGLSSPPTSLPSSNPVWQDMASIQNSPALPTFQQQPLSPTPPYSTTLTTYQPIQSMSSGWTNTVSSVPGSTTAVAASPMPGSYQLSPSPYMQTGAMPPLQPQFTQTPVPFAAQQQNFQQPQPIYVSNGVAVQPPVTSTPSPNLPMWTQGGYGATSPGHWQQ